MKRMIAVKVILMLLVVADIWVAIRSQNVQIGPLQFKHSIQALGSSFSANTTIQVLSQQTAAVPLNWYFGGDQVWNVFMSNAEEPTLNCRYSPNCDRFPLNATITSPPPELVLLHEFTIRSLSESDNGKELRIEYSTTRQSLTLNVKECNTSSAPKDVKFVDPTNCGYDCVAFLSCGKTNVTARCQDDATFKPRLSSLSCPPDTLPALIIVGIILLSAHFLVLIGFLIWFFLRYSSSKLRILVIVAIVVGWITFAFHLAVMISYGVCCSPHEPDTLYIVGFSLGCFGFLFFIAVWIWFSTTLQGKKGNVATDSRSANDDVNDPSEIERLKE